MFNTDFILIQLFWQLLQIRDCLLHRMLHILLHDNRTLSRSSLAYGLMYQFIVLNFHSISVWQFSAVVM